jgi:manganese-dependent inorganic pyrophosphatase
MAITVLGHINPDTDTTCSSLVYAWFLQQQGSEAVAVRTGPLNKETAFVLSSFGVAAPELLDALTADHEYALVDTNNPDELLPGWRQAKLVSIIDHHKLFGGIQTSEPITLHFEPVACTATILLGLMDQANVTPPREIAGLMLGAILSDTVKFTSPTTTDIDRQAAERLSQRAEMKIDEFAAAMFAAKSDISDLSPADILRADRKIVEIGEERIGIAVFETTDPESVIALRPALEKALRELKEEEHLSAALLFVVDILASNAELLVPSDYERELAGRAFNLTFTHPTLALPGVVSRKKQIIPPLENYLSGS